VSFRLKPFNPIQKSANAEFVILSLFSALWRLGFE
jgi:hypothetical protein